MNGKSKWVIGFLLLIVVGGGLLFVFPWRSVEVTPVVLKMEAPAESEIELIWSSNAHDEAFRLVPLQVDEKGDAQVWLTEVPPRLSYFFKLHFKSPIEAARFHEIKAFQLAPKYEAIWIFKDKGYVPESIETDQIVEFPNPLEMEKTHQWPRDLRLFVGFVIFFLIGVALWFSGLRFPDRISTGGLAEVAWKRRLSYMLLVVFGLIYWHLLAHSIPSFWPADSTTYVLKGLSILEKGTYDNGTHEFEFNRLPGYPLFIALSFAVFGPSINALMLLQGAFTLFSLMYLMLTLRGRWLRDEVLWVVIPLSILSPAMIWGCRQIATEGVFVGTWFLSTALFLRGWATGGRSRFYLWSGFVVVVTYATYIRANGVLLLVLPGCYGVGCVWRCLLAARFSFWRKRECWNGVGLLFAMAFVVMGALLLWGYRNWIVRDYPYPTDLAPIVAANGPFNAGMLDFRAIGHSIDYETAIRDRYRAGYFYHGWALRNRLFVSETKQWTEMAGSNRRVDARLYAFVEMNTALIPTRARLMAWWRVLDWGLWFPPESVYTRDLLSRDYVIETDFASEGNKATVHKRMSWLDRQMGTELRIEKGQPSFLVTFFNQFVGYYAWYYRLLVLASVVGLFVAIQKKRYVALALMVPFWVNVFLNVYFLYIVGRYVQVFDVCLILGIALAYFSPANKSELQVSP